MTTNVFFKVKHNCAMQASQCSEVLNKKPWRKDMSRSPAERNQEWLRGFSQQRRGQSPLSACHGRSRWRSQGRPTPTQRAPPTPCPLCTRRTATASSSVFFLSSPSPLPFLHYCCQGGNSTNTYTAACRDQQLIASHEWDVKIPRWWTKIRSCKSRNN